METVLLSRYLSDHNFELKSIHITWHSVKSVDSLCRGFYAEITACDLETGEEETFGIRPGYVTTDKVLSFGYGCNDLYLSEDSTSFPGLTVLVWDYAKYGDTIAKGGEIKNEFETIAPDYPSRLSRLFCFPSRFE